MFQPKTPIGRSKKFFKRWSPYFVVKQTGPTNYILADAKTMKEIPYPVNVDRIKPRYTTRDLFHHYDRSAPTADRNTPNVPTELAQDTPHPGSQPDPTSDIDDSHTSVPSSQDTHCRAPVQASKPNNFKYVEKITGVRTIGNTKHYRCIWRNNHKPSWVAEQDISEALKREFHVRHTARGTIRQDYRHPRRANQ